MGLKLYELTSQYEELVRTAADCADPADAQMFADTIEGLQGEIAEKVENCAAVVKTLDAEADAIREEEKRLAARRQSLGTASDRLKLYMLDSLKVAQLPKIKGKLFAVSIQLTPPSVVLDIDDPAKLPPALQRIRVEPDKSQIGEMLKMGAQLAYAHLEQKETLRIR
jgi:hypothetical protein